MKEGACDHFRPLPHIDGVDPDPVITDRRAARRPDRISSHALALREILAITFLSHRKQQRH